MTNEQQTITANFNAPIQLPQINQPGYTFGGWLENNRAVRFTTMPLGNRTLVASFNARNYTLSFTSELGTPPAPIEAAFESSVNLPTMSVEHFTFKGWQGPNGMVQGSFQVPLDGASFKAVFEPVEYTISFSGEGINIPPITVPFEGAISLPSPTKDGHRFSGWTLNGQAFNTTQMPGENITLVGQFEPVELTLRFISEGQVIRQSTLFVNDTFSLPTAQKRGHTFEGWFDGNTQVRNGVMPARNLTLQARFLINSYPVVLNDHEASETIRVEYDSVFELPEKERIGYRFNGWSYNNQIVESITISDITHELTAVYEPLTAVIQFSTPSETLRLQLTTDETINQLSSLNVPSGYIWQGYFTSPFGAGEPVTSGWLVDNAHGLNIYPYYSNLNQTYEVSTGRLSTTPFYHGPTGEPLNNEGNVVPWLEIITFTTLSVGLIGLTILSKGGKHENI